MKLRRRAGLFAILAAIILAIAYGFMPKPLPVETAEVKRKYMRVAIEEEGRTRIIDRFIISAPVAGFARRIELDAGDPVSKGEAITELEPLRSNVLDPRSRAEAKARVAAAEASLRAVKENVHAAKASAEFAKKELDRLRQLFKDALVAQEKLDEAETETRRTAAALRSSEFAVEVARHKKAAALTALKYSAAREPEEYAERVIIKAPVSGRVLRINHKSEGVVNRGQPLIEIGDPQALEVEADLLSADAVRISPGTPVLFERWGGDKLLKGRVRVVEPAGFTKISALGVEEQRVLVISDIVSPPGMWAELGDGYRVEASFILWENDNVLQIPASALFRYGDGWAVFVFSNERARMRKVQIGYRNGLSAQILSGLAAGDKVITHPDSSIKEGARVRLRKERTL
ncbi:MAG TPA: efflux RND transporter periplasmic adaptor subunit [Nitrospirae bacterium]|nr:macrolide export protein MacA [bacterium BMS3Abin06]HDH10879.1 efflux RND transporter periplasmic adaptor subunit [Nitrospirota bacterium]HDL20867.1 efflux RND transporter periplasmic adaptor subunit [Nitrospirota bacterium]HDZ03239.1 efflux RND transporter periplasmic adaptor subunit [Nitrospirota bacterium]